MKSTIQFVSVLALTAAACTLHAQVKKTPSAPLAPPAPVAPKAPRAPAEIMAFDSLSPAARPLAIFQDPADPKRTAEMEEDLNVMARVLTKAALGPAEDTHRAMGIPVPRMLFGSSPSPQNLYLDGYGAVFFLEVGFPLQAPSAKADEAAEETETNSEWESARRELYQRDPEFHMEFPNGFPFGNQATEPYTAEKVDRLKANLIAALKNAAHIRNLKPDDSVTLVVTARSGSESRMVSFRAAGTHEGHGVANRSGGGGGSIRASGTSASPRLVLKAKLADILAFQKNSMSLEEFRSKVSVSTL